MEVAIPIVVIGYAFICYGVIFEWTTFEHFNPVYNYKQWREYNWFGVAIGTIFLNLFFAPFAIIFWFWKLCRVGRR